MFIRRVDIVCFCLVDLLLLLLLPFYLAASLDSVFFFVFFLLSLFVSKYSQRSGAHREREIYGRSTKSIHRHQEAVHISIYVDFVASS